jgi:hypothetical protein
MTYSFGLKLSQRKLYTVKKALVVNNPVFIQSSNMLQHCKKTYHCWKELCMCIPGLLSAYSLANPACNAHAPCCEVCGPPLSPPYFSALFHKPCDFRKTDILHKICVLIFSTTFVQNISHSENNIKRYFQKYRTAFI